MANKMINPSFDDLIIAGGGNFEKDKPVYKKIRNNKPYKKDKESIGIWEQVKYNAEIKGKSPSLSQAKKELKEIREESFRESRPFQYELREYGRSAGKQIVSDFNKSVRNFKLTRPGRHIK